MSSSGVPQETAAQQDVLTFARLCPFNDGDNDSDDGRGRVEYEVLRDADDDDEDEPDEVSHEVLLLYSTGSMVDGDTFPRTICKSSHHLLRVENLVYGWLRERYTCTCTCTMYVPDIADTPLLLHGQCRQHEAAEHSSCSVSGCTTIPICTNYRKSYSSRSQRSIEMPLAATRPLSSASLGF